MTAGRSTVLYDESCRMCTALASWLAARTASLVVVPIGSRVADRLLRDLDLEARYASVHVVDAAGRRRSGGAAVPVVLAALPRGRRAAQLARRMPWATEAGYRLVARNRAGLSRLVTLSRASRRAFCRPRGAARPRDDQPGS